MPTGSGDPIGGIGITMYFYCIIEWYCENQLIFAAEFGDANGREHSVAFVSEFRFHPSQVKFFFI